MTEDVAQTWLALYCQTLAGARAGLVVRAGPERGAPEPIAHWPKTDADASDLLGVARAALVDGRVEVRRCDSRRRSSRMPLHSLHDFFFSAHSSLRARASRVTATVDMFSSARSVNTCSRSALVRLSTLLAMSSSAQPGAMAIIEAARANDVFCM